MIEGLGIINFPCDEKIVDTLQKVCHDENYLTGVIATGDTFLSKEEKKQTDQNKSSSLHQTENQYIEFYRRNRKIIDSLEKIPSAIKQPIESMIIHIATVY